MAAANDTVRYLLEQQQPGEERGAGDGCEYDAVKALSVDGCGHFCHADEQRAHQHRNLAQTALANRLLQPTLPDKAGSATWSTLL